MPKVGDVNPANKLQVGSTEEMGYDGFKADLFAAGILLLKMVAGKNFDYQDKQLYEWIGSKDISDIWSKIGAPQITEEGANKKFSDEFK